MKLLISDVYPNGVLVSPKAYRLLLRHMTRIDFECHQVLDVDESMVKLLGEVLDEEAVKAKLGKVG